MPRRSRRGDVLGQTTAAPGRQRITAGCGRDGGIGVPVSPGCQALVSVSPCHVAPIRIRGRSRSRPETGGDDAAPPTRAGSLRMTMALQAPETPPTMLVALAGKILGRARDASPTRRRAVTTEGRESAEVAGAEGLQGLATGTQIRCRGVTPPGLGALHQRPANTRAGVAYLDRLRCHSGAVCRQVRD